MRFGATEFGALGSEGCGEIESVWVPGFEGFGGGGVLAFSGFMALGLRRCFRCARFIGGWRLQG